VSGNRASGQPTAPLWGEEDAVRPIIFFTRQATCRQPEIKRLTQMDDSIFFNSWRMDDV